jgi:hypothetical protein
MATCLLTSPPASHIALTIMPTDNPRLPLDLQESILSHLAGSLDLKSCRPMLASCTLVCHAWCCIVQAWIFTKIEIRANQTQMDKLTKFFGASSPSHHLSKHIKSITVARYTATIPSLIAMLRAMDEREMFRLFNNVEHIALSLVHDSLSEEGITLLSQFRQLRKMQLRLTKTRVVSFHHLLSSFPALIHLALDLEDASFSDSGSAHIQAFKLQRLEIFRLDRSSTFLPGIKLDVEYLTLEWCDGLRNWDATSFIRSVIASITLENIKTLNLVGHTRDAADVNSGKSWRPSTTHSACVLTT